MPRGRRHPRCRYPPRHARGRVRRPARTAGRRRDVPDDPTRSPGADRVGPASRHDPPRRRGGHRQLRRRPDPQAAPGGHRGDRSHARLAWRPTPRQERHARRRSRRPQRALRQATAEPKRRDGIVESIRVLRNTRASAVKARTQAILHLKNLIVTAPDELRDPLTISPPAARRPLRAHAPQRPPRQPRRDPLRAAHPRSSPPGPQRRDRRARRPTLTELTARRPRLLKEPGIGPEIAARLLLVAGDNPDPAAQRLRPGRALRRLTDRSLKRQDHPPPPQPRRRPPRQQRALADRQQPHDPPPRRPATTSSAAPPKARAPKRSAAASCATSPAASTRCSSPTSKTPTAIALDIGASTPSPRASSPRSRRSSSTAGGGRKAELRSEVFEYIEFFFNRHRRHCTLGCARPQTSKRALSAPADETSPLRGSRPPRQ